jgi:hypothetical protein
VREGRRDMKDWMVYGVVAGERLTFSLVSADTKAAAEAQMGTPAPGVTFEAEEILPSDPISAYTKPISTVLEYLSRKT